MQEKEFHEYVYPLKRKPAEIVIRISKEVIPHKDELCTTARIMADNHVLTTIIQSRPVVRLTGEFDGEDMDKLKKYITQKWFQQFMYDMSIDEEVYTLLADFIDDAIEIGGF